MLILLLGGVYLVWHSIKKDNCGSLAEKSPQGFLGVQSPKLN